MADAHAISHQPPWFAALDEALRDLVYDSLVSYCGATFDPPNRAQFAAFWAGDGRDYRFFGDLGWGGKFWRTNKRWYVNCYREDETPERLEMIQRTNRVLAPLLDAWHAMRQSCREAADGQSKGGGEEYRLVAEARTYAKNVRSRSARNADRIASFIEELAGVIEDTGRDARWIVGQHSRVRDEPILQVALAIVKRCAGENGQPPTPHEDPGEDVTDTRLDGQPTPGTGIEHPDWQSSIPRQDDDPMRDAVLALVDAMAYLNAHPDSPHAAKWTEWKEAALDKAAKALADDDRKRQPS